MDTISSCGGGRAIFATLLSKASFTTKRCELRPLELHELGAGELSGDVPGECLIADLS